MLSRKFAYNEKSKFLGEIKEDDSELTDYMWPIIREMIKTAIENKQNKRYNVNMVFIDDVYEAADNCRIKENAS